jgi:uncharacterized protein
LSFLTRRRFLHLAAGTAAAGVIALAGDGTILEPNRPQLKRMEIPLQRLPPAFDGFTIVQISDFHYDKHFSVVPIQAAIAMVNQLNADLIVLTGDFITVPVFAGFFGTIRKAANAAEPCAALLAGLRSRLGMFAVLGNHDAYVGGQRVAVPLETHGIQVLRNRCFPIERDGRRLWLCGLDDVMEGDPKIDEALHGVPRNEAVILLVHEPDFAGKVAAYPVDLQLSGHSHGGQIWIPGIGAPWLPPGARKFPRGLYQLGRLTLYTNIGLGTIRIPVRLNCPPEVTLITLRAANETHSATS